MPDRQAVYLNKTEKCQPSVRSTNCSRARDRGESCPAEGPSTESKPAMGISWASPELGELQYIQNCWKEAITCQGTRAGGIYNGPYSIHDWYRDNLEVRVMRTYTAVVERCPDTGMYVGYVPGFPGAHTQAESLDELNTNLREVIGMLLEEGEPGLEAEFVGTQTVIVG